MASPAHARVRPRIQLAPALLAAVLAVAVVPPLFFLIQSSLYTTGADGSLGAPTMEYYEALATSPEFFSNFLNTVIYSLGSALVAIVVGAVQAWIAERTNTPLRQHLYLISIISLGVPFVLYTVSWLLILGRAGPVNKLFQALFETDALLVNVYSMWGMILIEGLLWSPLAFLLLSAVFRNSDASFEEAALMSGARLTQTLRLITLRLSLPALLALAMLVFIRAFESFEVPALVGMPGKVYVLTTDVYEHIYLQIPPDYGAASSFAVVLLVVVALLLVLYGRLSRHAYRYHTVTGRGFRPRVINLGKWRYLTAAMLVGFFLVILVLPLATIGWAALLPFYQTFSIEALDLITLDNFVKVDNSPSFHDSLWNTLILGAGSATAVTAFSALCGWMIARGRPGAGTLDLLCTSPLAFPSIVMGIAFLSVFVQVPFALYGTVLSLVIAASIAYLPYGVRYAHVGTMQIHTELEEAAGISGARQARTFFAIIAPLVAPALISCWLFVFLLAVRAVAMTLVLVGPDSQVVAVTLFDLWNNGQVGELAAMGLVWTAIMSVLSTLFYFSVRRYGLMVH